MNAFPVAMRLGFRELRGGLKGFGVFLACIALGVAAITGVGSLARGLGEGLARNGQAILGGDLSFEILHRGPSADERAFIDSLGRTSTIVSMRAMARNADGADQTLVELKGVDGAYPLAGEMRLANGGPLGDALTKRGDAFGAVAEEALFTRLNVERGARVSVGGLTIELRDMIVREPDRVAGGAFGFGPRLMISQEALNASGLAQTGSLATWRVRALIADATEPGLAATVATARERFPSAGWDIDTRLEAAPSLSANIERLGQFLSLVGLTALIVGGVGVANAVRSYLESKREAIATLKCLGATGGTVFAVYLTQIAALALTGIAIGLTVGAALPIVVPALLGDWLPFDIVPGLYGRELLLGLAYGSLTALAFALWPLGRARDVAVSTLFRDQVSDRRGRPPLGIIAAVIGVTLLLAGLAIGLADDRRVAAVYMAATASAFLILRLTALGIMALARRLPRSRITEIRLAIANIHRPGALTSSVVLSLGLGLTLLVSVAVIDANLRRQLSNELAANAPSFFFLDIRSPDRDRFVDFLQTQAPDSKIESAPMLRGRFVNLKGVPVETYQSQAAADVRWVLNGDRGLTYAADLPKNSRVTSGAWWPADHSGESLVSFDAKLGQGLGLAIGDQVTINVLGRNVTARIANFRTVEWETLGINFVMLFSPNTFRAAPHAHMATLTWPGGGDAPRERLLLKEATQAFPSVISVRVKEALEAVNGLIANIAWAVRGASSVALASSILVLAGALAAGHRSRIYDAVILKTLGATRPRLLAAFGLEYLTLGLVTAVFGVLAGLGAGYVVVSQIMNLRFTFELAEGLVAAGAALTLTVALGLIGTWRALGKKPAPVLRNL